MPTAFIGKYGTTQKKGQKGIAAISNSLPTNEAAVRDPGNEKKRRRALRCDGKFDAMSPAFIASLVSG